MRRTNSSRMAMLAVTALLLSLLGATPSSAAPAWKTADDSSLTGADTFDSADTSFSATTFYAESTYTSTTGPTLGTTQTPSHTHDPESGSLFNVAARVNMVDLDGTPLVPHTGDGVIIAMIDTGVVDVAGLQHSNVVVGPDFSFEDQYPELRGRDTNGHGTHLAGIMVATDEAWASGDSQRRPGRVLGVAPNATLLSIKAGSADGGVDVTQIIAAINWVTMQKTTGAIDIDVLNLSFSVDSRGFGNADPLMHAVERAWDAGIVVVVAAGNEGRSWQLQNPARSPYVIAVGASELEGEREASTDFTSTGLYRAVDVQAPGRSIASLRVVGAWYEQFNEAGRVGNDLVRGSGTSQAAAVVSGAAAVLLEARPELTNDQVKAILMESSWTPTKYGYDRWSGERYLDVLSALSMKVPAGKAAQRHEPSDGTGSIDATRGHQPLVGIDGIGLTGEQDIFGNDWSDSAWTVDSWTNNSWSGGSWAGGSWAGGSWAGGSWAADMWAGGSWAGGSWAGGSWAGGSWAGGSWAGGSWAGGSWAGGSWAGGSWAGGSWAGAGWN